MLHSSKHLAGFCRWCCGLILPMFVWVGCDKNELSSPSNNPKLSRSFHFRFQDEDEALTGTVQLRLAISKLEIAHGNSKIVWDTIIEKQTIYALRKEFFSVHLEDVKNAMINYTLIANDGGVIKTRSGSEVAGEFVVVRV